MRQPTRWEQIGQQNPDRSQWYVERFRTMAAQGADLAALLAPDILPQFTADEMAARGVQLPGSGAAHQGPLALVKLENGAQGQPLYIAGTENFYAITRYNWSSYYALSVIELGQEVAAAMGR